MAPKCKRCKAPCEKYALGYSVQCKACNERSGVLRRASYARRNHGNGPVPYRAQPTQQEAPKSIYERALADMKRRRALVDNAIQALEAVLK